MQILIWLRSTRFVTVTSVSPPFVGSPKYGTLTVTGFVPLTTRLSPVGPVAVADTNWNPGVLPRSSLIVCEPALTMSGLLQWPAATWTSDSGPDLAPSTTKWNTNLSL